MLLRIAMAGRESELSYRYHPSFIVPLEFVAILRARIFWYQGFAELFSTPAYVAKHPEMVEKIKSLVTTSTQQRRVVALTGTHSDVDLGKIRHKTMVVAGEEDQLVPLSAVRKLVSLIPNAELKIIPAAGHTALLENPDMYSSLVREFLNVKSRN